MVFLFPKILEEQALIISPPHLIKHRAPKNLSPTAAGLWVILRHATEQWAARNTQRLSQQSLDKCTLFMVSFWFIVSWDFDVYLSRKAPKNASTIHASMIALIVPFNNQCCAETILSPTRSTVEHSAIRDTNRDERQLLKQAEESKL